MKPRPHSDAASGAAALTAAGRIGEAYHLLEEAARGGDGVAAATLAHWRLSGEHVRRDLPLSRELFGRAAELGIDEAEPVYIAMLANGAGGAERRWAEALARLRRRAPRDALARLQHSLLRKMKLDGSGSPLSLPRAESLSAAPRIERVEQFMTAEECAYLVRRAQPMLEPAVVVDPATGRLIQDPIRSSSAAGFPFVLEDPLLHALNRRIAAVTGTSYEQGEPLQVLSYSPGQEYKLHSDALPPGGNQRALTLLVYLNDDYEGGETYFPQIGLSHRGRTGDAILFANADSQGRPDAAARHAGLPVRRGTKLLLSKWIRAAPLDLSGPPGRPL